jgi:hypothetical protein
MASHGLAVVFVGCLFSPTQARRGTDRIIRYAFELALERSAFGL